jgi:hypothetical protein
MANPNCTGTADCPCTANCERHGKCCECMRHHRAGESLTACMKRCAALMAAKDPDGFLQSLQKTLAASGN